MLGGERMVTWAESQRKYILWAKSKLPYTYIQTLIQHGRLFADYSYIEDVGSVLDVGCGNGIIGGVTYEELGYSYIRGEYIACDPLPNPHIKMPFTQCTAEELREFYPMGSIGNVIIATSIDHFQDIDQALYEINHILKHKGWLHIWVTFLDKPDDNHPNRLDYPLMHALLNSNGFDILDRVINTPGMGDFLKCRKRA